MKSARAVPVKATRAKNQGFFCSFSSLPTLNKSVRIPEMDPVNSAVSQCSRVSVCRFPFVITIKQDDVDWL